MAKKGLLKKSTDSSTNNEANTDDAESFEIKEGEVELTDAAASRRKVGGWTTVDDS